MMLRLPLLLPLLIQSTVGQQDTLTQVSNATELQQAISAGAAHIVVVEHLELSHLASTPKLWNTWNTSTSLSASSFFAFVVQPSTVSITGRCKQAPSRSDLAAEWREGQCILDFADSGGFWSDYHTISAGSHNLWLDHLYFRMSEPSWDLNVRFGVIANAALYVTNVTLQGSGSARTRVLSDIAIWSYAEVAASGLQILNFGPAQGEALTANSAQGQATARVNLVDSLFQGNIVSDRAGDIDGGAIGIYADMKLERVTFSNNSGSSVAAEFDICAMANSVVYSDANSVKSYYSTHFGGGVKAEPLSAAPDGFPELDDEVFVIKRDLVEAALLDAGLGLPFTEPLPPTSTSTNPQAAPLPASPHLPTAPEDEGTVGPPITKASLPPSPPSQVGAIAGAIVGGLAVIACVTIAVFVLRRRRVRDRSAPTNPAVAAPSGSAPGAGPAATSLQVEPARPAAEWVTITHPCQHDDSSGFAWVPNPAVRRLPADSMTAQKVMDAERVRPAADWVTMTQPDAHNASGSIAWVPAPGKGAPCTSTATAQRTLTIDNAHDVMAIRSVNVSNADTTRSASQSGQTVKTRPIATKEELEDALDDMHAHRERLMGTWTVLSATNRRVGGHGVVQFLVDPMSGESLVAKFFLDGGAAFECEAELYANADVRAMMAAVVEMQDNRDGELKAPNGLVFPPFIVLERGHSLDEWALITKPDFVTSVQVLVQIVERLHALHTCRLVHRDIKPANILWRTNVGTWTLIDFGCAMRTGHETRIACSVPYSPPEVAQALKDQQPSMKAHTSMDVWALGVVTWELLVGARAFPGKSVPQILDALTSTEPLPWEPGSERAGSMKKLGLVRRVVADCLNRDPKQRPSAEQLLGSMNGLFRLATTQGNTDSRWAYQGL